VVHIDGLADKRLVSQSVIDQITGPISTCVDPVKAYFELRDRVLSSSGIAEVHCMDEFLGRVVGGDCGVFVHGVANGLACDTKGWERRGVEEPTTESTIRGPKEGFIESLRTNTSMLRRRIKDPRLWFEELKIGRITQTCVAVVHISGVADKRVVEEVRNRLRQVDTDSIQESGHLEEYIEDAPSSPFPTVLRCWRPRCLSVNRRDWVTVVERPDSER
ncbi:MAG: spore germination protein, partial [Anaerolineales bacterium]|nr:spore germination protein [Anaerolineales bacterium]